MIDTISACRSCGGTSMETVLEIGDVPLANGLLDRPERSYPLTLAFCPQCSLVQILETVDPSTLFGRYTYFSSFSDTMLMSYAGIGSEHIDFVVDRSTVKQGRYTPGNRLPILSPDTLLERRPNAVLLLTWNFAGEIVRQQRDYLDGGGQFIVPVPRVHTIGREVPV